MGFLDTPISIFPIRPLRKIGEITVNVVVDENTNDTLTITKQPVQQGASITDHAYKEPTVFNTNIYFKNNSDKSLSKIYQDLLDLQISRVPFNIVTPKRIYKTMLLASLNMTTDKLTENVLKISASFQEIILVPVATTTVPRMKQKSPRATDKTENAGKKSFLFVGGEGVTGLLGGGG